MTRPMDKMDRTTFLYNVPPSLIEHLCKIIDSGDDQFGWRGLAARIVPSWLEVRRAERLEAAGRSPARELLWTWAQQNPTVADLVRVLEDMGHHWALQLFVQPGESLYYDHCRRPTDDLPVSRGNFSPPVKCEESDQLDESFLHQVGLLRFSPCSTGSEPEGAEGRALTYDDVVGGTKHFHHDLKIAAGSLSDTYKGALGTATFVVKRFKTGNDPSWKERWDSFTRDTEVHHLFQHPNILNLLGCFLEDGNHCLVYPYLANGSLHQRLHDLVSDHLKFPFQQPAQPLSWQQRLSVIKGAAKGLHHLHTAPLQPLICGNITSAHVLLDHALRPQLSNVGLSRLRPPPPRQTTALSTQSIHGNLGYLPPEFIRHDGKPSCSLDVYSFGMVMMETITGRKVVEESPKRSLLRDVLSVERDDSGGSVDSCVRFLDGEAGSWPYPTACSLLRLALDCTAARPRNRPCMDTVLRELSQLLPVPSLLSPAPSPFSADGGRDPHYREPGLPLTSHPPSTPPPPPPPPSPPPPPLQSHPPSEDGYDDGSYVASGLGPDSAKPLPREFSQSELIFWSSCEDAPGRHETGGDLMAPAPGRLTEAGVGAVEVEAAAVDLYNSWPVQCSCQADSGELGCEDCRANGFTLEHSDTPPFSEAACYSSWNVVENPAKQTLRAKLALYNEGVLNTEELVSL
ncbi:interleukin-1 receptor-associated kinase 3-like isoform X1 [Gadus macrocephalus]|uniref:interleukin-1 receptor-associated kinase 3-like isoform X1 n=1 Tax=Gadus macrocephalus TaxID=80720 RepID=UPI0028CB2C64|nr:interleukin-1 receptor-associated kinase 3-like isoform X1 [Gadus macrocephalus]